MKRRHKYQLSLNDASRLRTVWRMRITIWRALAMLITLLVVSTALAVVIIVSTPIRTYLPGYMKQDQRSDALKTMMLVDSLQRRYDLNQAYLDNLLKILDTDRPATDSTSLSRPDLDIKDTLMVAGKAERAFVREMEEREKFNISITAPLAAEGMIFAMPAEGAIVSADTKNANTATVILPRGEGIDAISDGTVIDKHYDLQTRTYTIVIQHSKGFVSQYRHLGNPVVDLGERVIAGQEIARQATGGVAHPEMIYLQIWRHGLPLISSEYLRGYSAATISEEIEPGSDRDKASADKARVEERARQLKEQKEKEEGGAP